MPFMSVSCLSLHLLFSRLPVAFYVLCCSGFSLPVCPLSLCLYAHLSCKTICIPLVCSSVCLPVHYFFVCLFAYRSNCHFYLSAFVCPFITSVCMPSVYLSDLHSVKFYSHKQMPLRVAVLIIRTKKGILPKLKS